MPRKFTVTKAKLQQMLIACPHTQFQVEYFDDMVIIRVSPVPEHALLYIFDRNHTLLTEENTTPGFGPPVAKSKLNNAQCYHLDRIRDRLTLFLPLKNDGSMITSTSKTTYLNELQHLLSRGQRLHEAQPHFLLRLWQSVYDALVRFIERWFDKPSKTLLPAQENYLTI